MIRQAIGQDLRRISVMGGSFIKDSISSDFITHDTDNFHGMLISLSDAGVLTVWVAVTGDKIMGAAALLLSPNVYNSDEILADIYFIDVVPKYRKQGLAKELMSVAEKHAKEKGAVAVTISFKNKDIADRVAKKGYGMFEYKLIKSLR